jgi:large subunit ribosomal protein L9
MQIILLERVAKLGQMGEVVNVKDGYARNFLLPQGKGLRVNATNLARFEAEKAALEARNVETRTTAQADADKIDGETFVIIRSASDSGSLYGSVTPRDVADAGAEHGFKIDRNQVVLQGPIKDLGLHDVMLNLHPEVTAMVTLNIARSKDEAELQAAGKSIQELAAEEEAAAEFEIQELFDDLGAASNDDDE